MSGKPNDSAFLARWNGAEGTFLHATGADLKFHVREIFGALSCHQKCINVIFYER